MDHPAKPHTLPPYDGPDRRRYRRRTVQVPIELHLEGSDRVLTAETTDLSRNGCYILLPDPLPVGLWLQAILWLDGEPAQLSGRVVTRHPHFGNGIMFLKVPEREDRVLAAYLEAVIQESVT